MVRQEHLREIAGERTFVGDSNSGVKQGNAIR